MFIPVWAALISGSLLLTGTVVTAWFVFRGKKAELAVTEDANHSAEEAKLRGDQRELINTLKGIPASYQELLKQYAESIKQGAETQASLTILKSETDRNKTEISMLRAEFMAMKRERDVLQAKNDAAVAEREKLLTQSARVPLLEEQLKDRDKTIRLHVATIKQQAGQIAELIDKFDTATVLLDAATRGQERVEGALAESAGTVKSLSAALDKDC